MIRQRVGLLTELALALAELGWASRVHVEAGGESALMVRAGVGAAPVGVVVIQDRAGWAFLWSGAQRFPVTDRQASVRQAAARLVGVR